MDAETPGGSPLQVTERAGTTSSATELPAARRRKSGLLTRVSHRGEYVAFRAAAAGLGAVSPERASAVMGAVMARVMARTSRHGRALEHVAFAMPELSEEEREAVVRGMWRNLGRVAGEAFHIRTILAEPERFELPPEFADYKRLARGGLIGATPHLGNWELAGLLSRIGDVPLAAVYQAFHNPLMERRLRTMRADLYPAGLFSKGPQLGAQLLALARQGAGIGIVADLREVRGVDVTFFGRPAFATPLPAMLARASGRPIIAGAMVRTGGVAFKALMEPVEVARTQERERDIAEATQAIHTIFERWIRAHPDQWMWTHRKWARRRASPLSAREIVAPSSD